MPTDRELSAARIESTLRPYGAQRVFGEHTDKWQGWALVFPEDHPEAGERMGEVITEIAADGGFALYVNAELIIRLFDTTDKSPVQLDHSVESLSALLGVLAA